MAIKAQDFEQALERTSHFGGLDDIQNDPSSWRVAMASHRNLYMTELGGHFSTEKGRRELAPLGDATKIREYIYDLLDNARQKFATGELPRIYSVPANIPGDPAIFIPAEGLSARSQLAIQFTASDGLESIGEIAGILADSGVDARAVAEEEEEIRISLEGNPDYEDWTEDQFEQAVRDRLGSATGSDIRDAAADTIATNVLRDVMRARYPGETPAQIEDRIDELAVEAERQGRGTTQSRATAAQRGAAIATTAGSLTEALITAVQRGEDTLDIDVASDVIGAIGAACASLGVALSGVPIAGAVLVVIGVILELLGMILDAVREYTIDPEQGVNAEWNRRDLRLIIRERLRVISLSDDNVIDNFSELFQQTYSEYGNADQLEVLKNMVHQTARYRGWPERLNSARQIGISLGGSDENMRKIDDIKSWLSYVGVPDANCEIVWRWLYDARRVDAILKRRVFLKQHGRFGEDYTGYSGNFLDQAQANCRFKSCHKGQWLGGEDYQAPCDDYDIGPADPPGEGEWNGSARPNIWKGSNEWFRACQNLDTAGRDGTVEYIPFTLHHLKELYTELADFLTVGFNNGDGTFNFGPRMVEGPVIDISRHTYFGPSNEMLEGVLALENRVVLNVQGVNVIAAPSVARGDFPEYLQGSSFSFMLGNWSWTAFPRVQIGSALANELIEVSTESGEPFPTVIREFLHSTQVRQAVANAVEDAGGAGSSGVGTGGAVAIAGLVGAGVYALSKIL